MTQLREWALPWPRKDERSCHGAPHALHGCPITMPSAPPHGRHTHGFVVFRARAGAAQLLVRVMLGR